ncbi:MAG: bacillithiol biosynthesis BshC, partial [Bacteroidetes bacterium]|nr:bacillithiol biosynthesis BshC [Bacteroidota bacterium]
LFSDQERLIAEWSDQKGEVSLVDAARELEQVYEGIIQKALSIDPQLDATVRAALQRQKKELEGLEKRFRKAIKQQEEVSIRQIEGLFSTVFPEGVFQERQQSFFALNELAGGELKQKLSSQLPVLEPGLSVVYV